ncbi:MAG: hypothetical protein NT026_02785 [Candidatus Staskawiczbacteria bacterium]|nr:hypothetical protein [Candidatus Staskawiczbacteria bacterium]
MDKIPLFIISVIIVAGVVFWAFQSGFFSKNNVTPTPLPEGIVLFYSPDCPHCKNVEDFIAQNGIDQKIKYTRLEVPFGIKTSPELQANAAALLQKAETCKIDTTNGISIPFIWDGKACLVGDEPIINFLKAQAGIK